MELQRQIQHHDLHMNSGDMIQIEAPDFDPDIDDISPPNIHQESNNLLTQGTASPTPKTTEPEILAKPRHQPSERDQQARERLRQNAKIKSCAYIQLGEKALQTVHQTFEPNTPVILHFPALTDTTIDTDTVPMLYVIKEGINACPPLTISSQASNQYP